MKRQREREKERGGDWERGRLALPIIFCLFLFGCAGRGVEPERRADVAASPDKLQSCAPGDEAEGDVKLAITSVTRQPNETSVQLVAYALDKPVEFDVPVYILSSGRWLIGGAGRAYLRDEQCREYKLKDKLLSPGSEAPLGGHVRLEAGRAFEMTLSFPRLPDEARMGVLVYGRRALPFLLSPSAQP